MIEIRDLFFSYAAAPPWVLSDLNLTVQPGDYISVVGDNGSGKSTLIRLILGFLEPTRGQIRVQARRTGYVPQRPGEGVSGFPITVTETLHAYRRLIGLRDRTAVSQALQRVGLEKQAEKQVGVLSGGQYQKMLIARALLGDPDLLILDEPSTGIDRVSQEEIYAFLNDLNRRQRLAIVSVDHNLEAAVANSTKIFHLVNGSGHLCSPDRYRREFLG